MVEITEPVSLINLGQQLLAWNFGRSNSILWDFVVESARWGCRWSVKSDDNDSGRISAQGSAKNVTVTTTD